MYDPIEGHVDPYGVTHAYAKSAQIGGAEIVRHTRVTDLQAARRRVLGRDHRPGQRARRARGQCRPVCGRARSDAWSGIELPVLAMEHQYLITGDMPELAGQKEQLHAIDFEGEIYTPPGARRHAAWAPTSAPACPGRRGRTPWDFGQDLLPNDLERIAPSLEVGFEHFPALGAAGISKVVNGPFTFAPDGNPLVGPVRGLQEFLGGLRRDGRLQPGRRRRTGARRSGWSTAIRARTSGRWTWRATASGRRSPTPTPRCGRTIRAASASAFRTRNCRPRGRCAPRRSTKSCRPQHAVFGDYCGLEHPLWFAPSAAEAPRGQLPALERASARGAECRAVRGGVGLLEISNYGKFEVEGPGAAGGCRASWRTGCRGGPHRADADAERARQADRRLHDCRVAEDHVFLIGTYAAEVYLLRWFERMRRLPG